MHPHSRAELDNKWKIIQHMAFLSALTVIVVTVRIFSRCMQWRRLSTDDYLLLTSTVLSLAANGSFLAAIDAGGLGHHIKWATREELVFFAKTYFAATIIVPTCYATAKLSLLYLLHRIFANTYFRRIVQGLAALTIGWWVSMVMLEIFICYPVNTRWNGTCKAQLTNKGYHAAPIPWIITNFLILIVPLPVLWKSVDTRKSRAAQIGILALFGAGIVTCSISIKRYLALLHIDYNDLTYSAVDPCLWTMIESSTTICCAALPGSTHALKRMLPLGAMTRAVNWVDGKISTVKNGHFTSRNPEVPDVEANGHSVADAQQAVVVVK